MAAAATLVVAGAGGALASHKTVTVDVDGKKQTYSVFTFGTVNDFLTKHGVHVAHGDLVQPDEHTKLTNGLYIDVHHKQTVTIKDGVKNPVSLQTNSTTVAGVLREAGIQLQDTDKVNLALSAKPVNGMDIEITRRSTKVVTTQEAIPFQTERQPDNDAYKGQEKVLTPGVEGLAQITTTSYLENGKEVDKKTTKTMLKQPVNQVVAYGTQDQPVLFASRGGPGLLGQQSLTMVATGYTGGGNTASGQPAGVGSVAVDPNVIPLGTRLFIPGYGQAVANDVGGSIVGNRIDLYFNSVDQCRQFGLRTVTVYIVK